MPIIQLPGGVRRRQPQGAARVAANYASGLNVLFHAPLRANLAPAAKQFIFGGGTRGANGLGVGLGFSIGLGAARFADNTDVTYGEAFSIVWVASTANVANRTVLGSRVFSSGALRCFIVVIAGGGLRCEGTDTGSVTTYKADTGAGAVDGKAHVFSFVKTSAGVHQFYRDGEKLTTTTVAIGNPVNVAGSVFEIGGINTGFPGYDHQEPINLFALWGNRALPETDRVSLGKNPWQLFEPDTQNIFISAAVGGPTVGQVIETDTALAVTAAKTVALGQVTETGTAQVVTSAKTVALGMVTEADTAQVVTSAKAVQLGQATETNTAQAVSTTGTITVALGQAAEADTAQAVAVNPITRLLGQATETDTAQAITTAGTITVAVGQVTEAQFAQAVSAAKSLGILQPVEADSAHSIAAVKSVALGQTTETDTAQVVTVNPITRLLGQAIETDTAQAITVQGVAIVTALLSTPRGLYSNTQTASRSNTQTASRSNTQTATRPKA